MKLHQSYNSRHRKRILHGDIEQISTITCLAYDDDIQGSAYGNPEEAMLGVTEEEIPEVPEAWRRQYETVTGMLDPFDRLVLYLDLEGRGQTEIGNALGVSQPSVHARVKRLHDWVNITVPLRVEREYEVWPSSYQLSDHELDWIIYQRLVWKHQNQSQIAANLRMTQGKVRNRIRRMLKYLPGECNDTLRQVFEYGLRWSLPQRQPNHGVEYLRAIEGSG